MSQLLGVPLAKPESVDLNNRDASYPAELICSDVSPTCLKVMREAGLETVSFDLDSPDARYPFPDGHFDAVISLATIEHLMSVEHFLTEIRRILNDKGFLYLSAPNYSGLTYLLSFLATGKTFHDPMNETSRYEFFAHVRYFTFRTLAELVGSMGVYPRHRLPAGSARELEIQGIEIPVELEGVCFS